MKIYIGEKPRGKSKNYVNQTYKRLEEVDLGNPKTWLCLNKYDYTCIEFKAGERKESNFIKANCLYVDFDHFLDNPNPGAMLDIQNQILSPLNTPCLAIPSHSQLGFHAFFPIGSEITNVHDYKNLTQALIEKLGGKADNQVKDGARIGFGTGIADKLFLQQSQAINSNKPINLPSKTGVEADNHYYPNNYTPSTFDTYSEGSRNDNCHKLACSLLNRYSVDIAHSIYLSQCQGNGLSDRELETCFQSAVKSMIGEGLAYSDPGKREAYSQTVQMISKPVKVETKEANPNLEKEDKYKEEYLRDYALYGEKPASKILIEKTKLAGESIAFQNHLLHLATSRWIKNDFYYTYKADLESLGWNLKGKDINSIIQTVSDKNSTSTNAVTYIPQLTGWFAFNAKNGKWESVTEGEALKVLKNELNRLYEDVSTLRLSDSYFETNLIKALNLPNLNHFFKLYASTSYSEFEDKSGYAIPTPGWLYRFDEKGELTKEKITPKSHILNEFYCEPLFEKSDIWEKFLISTIPDQDDRLYLQMVLGSQILGITPPDQALYFWVGEGANGKSTLFNVMIRLFHDFQKVVNPETFSSSLNTKEAEYARAEFMDKRMVIANEASDKFVLDPSQVKLLTSTEQVEASRKYVNKFNFSPTHTGNIILNELPAISNVDDKGLYRRIRVFWFEQSFEGDKADRMLDEKLAREDQKIMGWLFEGAKLFIKNNLKIVENAHVKKWTEDYIKSNDTFSNFMNENTTVKATCIRVSDLRALYSEWAKINFPAPQLSDRQFGIKLQKKGYINIVKKIGGRTVRVLDGLGFNTSSTLWNILNNGKYRGDMPFIEFPGSTDFYDNGF